MRNTKIMILLQGKRVKIKVNPCGKIHFSITAPRFEICLILLNKIRYSNGIIISQVEKLRET